MDNVIESHAEVRVSPTSGHGLFATKMIHPGELVLSISRPLVGVLDLAYLDDACSNCFLWTAGEVENALGFHPLPVNACVGCKKVKYCSKKCQRQAWKREHKHICNILKDLPPLPNAVRAARELVVLMRGDQVSEKTKQAVQRMEHFDLSTSCSDDATKQNFAISVQASTDIVTREMPESAGEHRIIAEYVGKIWRNSLTLTTPTLDPTGLVFDPLLCSANHSCVPNTFVVMDGSCISFRALEPIAKGGEIFISYIDTSNPFTLRQRELLWRYDFYCKCSKCALGFASPENDFLSRTMADVDRACKNMGLGDASSKVDERYTISSSPAPSEIDLRPAAIQGTLFDNLADARSIKSPFGAVEKYKSLIQHCARTGIFPLTRQPYAAAYSEVIPHMLDAGLWKEGLFALVKVHFLIDPILYPQPFHPVRVVHTWTLVRVMMHLGDPDSKMGLSLRQLMPNMSDLDLVTQRLLRQLQKLVVQSHGAGSRFANMVQQAERDVSESFRGQDPAVIAGLASRAWEVFESWKDDKSLEQ